MVNVSSKENFYIGVSLSNSANYDSSVCIINRENRIVLLDKYYFNEDLENFLSTSPYLKSSVICISVPQDNSMLEGKWRIHSKNYKMISETFKINRQNWTKRCSNRLCDKIIELKNSGCRVFRFDTNQLRQAYGVCPHYLMRTSLDCKSLQSSLKLKYGFDELPDNMLPASTLEAIIGAMFARDIAKGEKTRCMYEFQGVEVLTKNF